uniref:FDX-ACB domain-containing protein n=1 Tax=Monopterus albus TaxID=43700 RepID=A0A3Q3J0T6_MONAL
MSPSRSILLVGEGNFSFSAAVSQLHAEQETSITATCLQQQDEALRHEGAAINIQIIKDSGGTVLFDVDCTKLKECASLQGRVFDRVVFNFPHCGRKSGVKKNRELLKNFFLSCIPLLAEDGEVHVSLCNGQGGTPVDQPKREWHNSWQVVAMAAEAHLILSDIQPFESERYQSYKCTGYRSQDKGFHVEKALLHVFTRSLPYTSAQMLKVEEVIEGGKVQYTIPAELSDFIFRYRNTKTHAICVIRHRYTLVASCLLAKKGHFINNAGSIGENDEDNRSLLLRGVFPSECEPIKLLGQRLETLLTPYGVCLVTEQGGLRLMAQPMGLVGKVFASNAGEHISHVSITVSLNLDLLAVLLFSLPDWRLLWSHDQRFLKQFALCPSPGTPFQPFSLFPEHFSFDISFWTGPTWEEKKFHAVVREASLETVEQVKLIDTFSHPDLSQTSYCYRLIYRSHTHALSHTQALQFHKHLESLLSSRLKVTIR